MVILGQKIFEMFKVAINVWSDANASRMSAALAYYTMLSISPLLVITVAAAGVVFSDQLARSELINQITLLASPEIADTVRTILRNSSRLDTGLLAGSVSLLVLLFGATGAFSQLYDTLNVIWRVEPERRSGIWYMVKQRLWGVLMVVLIGLLLTGSLVLGAIVSIATNRFEGVYPELVDWLGWVQHFSTLLLIPFLFVLLFKVVPARKVAWGDVWLGGLLTGAAFIFNRRLIGLYLQNSSVTSAYGAAGSLVVLLIWVYFSGLFVFFGASICKGYATVFGSLKE